MYRATLILFSFLILHSSCSDIKNDIIINTDGSGQLTIGFNPNTLIPEHMSSITENSPAAIFSVMSLPAYDKEGNMLTIDTSFTFIEAMMSTMGELSAEEIEAFENRPRSTMDQIFENAQIHLTANSTTIDLYNEISFDFKNQDGLSRFMGTINAMFKNDMNPDENATEKETTRFRKELESGILRLPLAAFPDGAVDGIKAQSELRSPKNESKDDENFMNSLGESLFGEIITTVTLPSDVEFTNCLNAEIEGNKVVMKRSMFNWLIGQNGKKDDSERLLKFKN